MFVCMLVAEDPMNHLYRIILIISHYILYLHNITHDFHIVVVFCINYLLLQTKLIIYDIY